MDADQVVVCLTSAPQEAFSAIAIKLDLNEEFAIDATISATTTDLTFTIPLPDSNTTPVLTVVYKWTQILLHSIDENQGIGVVIDCPQSQSLNFKLAKNSPALAAIINKKCSVDDAATNDGDNCGDDWGADDDEMQRQQTSDIHFTVCNKPASHIPILSIDFLPVETDDDAINSEGMSDNASVKANPVKAVEDIEQPSALLYQLFNQCVSLNPDQDADMDDGCERGMFDGVVIGDGDEDLMMFDGMFTEEFFAAQDALKQQQEQAEIDDEYPEDAEQRYKH